jgi:hypothetical protein
MAAVARPSDPFGRVGIGDALAARRGAAVDISELRIPAAVAGAIALFAVIAYRPAASWAMAHSAKNDLFVYHWIKSIVTIGSVHSWGPWTAGIGLVLILLGAARSGGVADAEAPAIAVLMAGGLATVVAAAPLILAGVVGIVALVVYIVLMILVMVVIVVLIGALLMGASS